jgi:hypothetical protein
MTAGLGGATEIAINLRGRGAYRPFDRLDDFITRGELRALSDRYKRIAGYSIEDLAKPAGKSAT